MSSSADLEALLIAAHQANIDRYREILASYLSPQERAVIEQRVSEEIRILGRLAGKALINA
jgi:hypothetical protein